MYPLINFHEIFHPILCNCAYQFINFQENFQPPCFSPTQMKNFPSYPLIKFEEKFQPTILLEPPFVLET